MFLPCWYVKTIPFPNRAAAYTKCPRSAHYHQRNWILITYASFRQLLIDVPLVIRAEHGCPNYSIASENMHALRTAGDSVRLVGHCVCKPSFPQSRSFWPRAPSSSSHFRSMESSYSPHPSCMDGKCSA